MEEKHVWSNPKDRRILFFLYSSLLIIFVVALVVYFTWQPITVSFIDVGHGDACLIQAGNGGSVLIDGGDTDDAETLKNFLNTRNATHLDAIFISHFHEDHVGGILSLLKNDFPVSNIFLSSYDSKSPFEKELHQIAKTKNIPIIRLQIGKILKLGKATYKVISQEPYTNDENFNNTSMILRMDYMQSSVLFTGDIETDASRRLVSQHRDDLDVSILKIPHHGGNSSASYELIKAATPDYAVISLDHDSYGNPSNSVLAYLLKANSKIYRTDRDGTITMTFGQDGIKNISYSNQRR